MRYVLGHPAYWVRADGQLMCGDVIAPNWFLDDNGCLPYETEPPPREHVVIDAPDFPAIEAPD